MGRTSSGTRTREIGTILHEMSNGTLDLMRQAHQLVSDRMGPAAAHDLSANWHMIGWQGTDEEFRRAGAMQLHAMLGNAVDPALIAKLANTWQH